MTKEKRTYENLRNLDLLLQAGKERTRLTEQLQEIVSEIIDEIADHLEVGDRVRVDGRTYEVARLESNIGEWRTIIIIADTEYCGVGAEVFNPNIKPGAQFYLHGDFQASYRAVSREDWLFTANNLPRIIAAFQAKMGKAIETLRTAFERMKALASAEAEEE